MESTLKRTWAEIDLDAIAHNYKTIREKTGKDVKFLGVVKADAYGHGSIRVSLLLQELGADYLAVSSIDEAMELRLNGITMPILILGHTPREQVSRLIEYNITQAVTCRAKAIEYSEEVMKLRAAQICSSNGIETPGAPAAGQNEDEPTLRIHIKVDTGMSRLGYLCEEGLFDTGVEGITYACSLPGLDAEGIFTHFAVSDEPGDYAREYTLHQFELFTKVIAATEEKLGRSFSIRHCANTGAVACYPQTYLDMVRPGLLLYGYGEFAAAMGLIPAMTLKTTVSTIKTYEPGTRVSYGGIFTTDRRTRMGVVPYGYADGFHRSLSNRCSLMTEYGPTPQRGKICMDMCMIDLTDLRSVDVGDEIEIFGKKNPIEEMSALAGTIPYELTCAVSKRVPRIYLRGGEIIEHELLLRM